MQPKLSSTPKSTLDTVSVIALLATLIITLVIFVPSSPIPLAMTKAFAVAVGTLITLAIYIIVRLKRGNIIFPPPLLLAAIWLPTLAYALSSIFSGDSISQAFWGNALESDTLGFILIATFLGTLAALILRRPENYLMFFRFAVYAFGAVVVAQWSIIVAGQFVSNIVSPTISLVGSLSDLASILGLGVVLILIALRFLELSKTVHMVLIIIGAFTLPLLVVANSSLAWVLVALASFGLFVESIMRQRSKNIYSDLLDSTIIYDSTSDGDDKSHSLVAPLIVLAVSLLFIMNGALGTAVSDTLHISTFNVRPSWESTLAIAKKTYETTPIFGSGPGTFGVEWLRNRDASVNSTIFWNVDFTSGIGFIPTSFVTTGGVGVFAWLVFLILFIGVVLRTLVLRSPKDEFVRFASVASFVGAIYLFSIAIFSVPNGLILALGFVFAGISISTMRFKDGGAQWGIIFSRSPRIGFIVVFILTMLLLASIAATFQFAQRYVSSVQLAKSSSAFASGDLNLAEDTVKKSLSMVPSAAAYQMQAMIANSRLAEIVASSTIERSVAQRKYQDTFTSGVSSARAAINMSPSRYQNWIALGNLFAQAVPFGISDAYVPAKEAYDKAKELNPTSPQIYFTLAQLKLANKNIKAAKNDLKSAILLKQDYTPAIVLLSQLEVQDGNVKEALDAALSAAYFAPNNPSILFQVGILYAARGDLDNSITALSSAVESDPQFANAHYFLAAVYAKRGNISKAIAHLQIVANMSSVNARAVSAEIAALKAGKNPFPSNLLSVPSTSVE